MLPDPQLNGRVEEVALDEVDVLDGFHWEEVDGNDSLAGGFGGLGDNLGPGAGGGAEVDDELRGGGAEEVVLFGELLELEGGAGAEDASLTDVDVFCLAGRARGGGLGTRAGKEEEKEGSTNRVIHIDCDFVDFPRHCCTIGER
jgi:hypothetical protein